MQKRIDLTIYYLSNFWKARIFDPILFLDSNLLISGMGDDNGKWLERCYWDLHLVQMEKEMWQDE